MRLYKGKPFIRLTDDQKPLKRVENFLSEFMGTFMLVFIGCMGCVAGITNDTLSHFQLAFSFGLAVMIPIQMCAHLSGGHINPTMTITSLMLGNISLVTSAIYFVAQMAGALAGYAMLLALNPWSFIHPEGSKVSLCSPYVHSKISALQGFGVEFIVSLALVLVACSVWDFRNRDKHDSVSIKFGLTVSGLAIVAGHYTGCNMNPARSFAPALLNGDWDNHWVYWVGPTLAAILGGGLYRFLFDYAPRSETDDESNE